MSIDKLIIVVMLVCLMLQSGLQVDRAALTAVLKDYSLLGRALLANFILVPLVAFAIVRLFHVTELIALGVMLMAFAPGIPFLPRAAGRKSGGSLGFALALTFLLPALSVVTMPFTARLLFSPGSAQHVPVTSLIVQLLIFQLLPLAIGAAVSARAPDLAAKLVRPLALIVALCILAILILISPALGKAIASVYGSLGMITALIVVLLSAAAGWLLGGPQTPYRNTLAIATAMRNPGLALLVATTDFIEPVAAMVMCYFLIQLIVSILLGKLFSRGLTQPETPAAASA